MIPFYLIYCQPTHRCQREKPLPSLSFHYGCIWDKHSPSTDFPPCSRSQKCWPKLSGTRLHCTAASRRSHSKASLSSSVQPTEAHFWSGRAESLPNQEASEILALKRNGALVFTSLEILKHWRHVSVLLTAPPTASILEAVGCLTGPLASGSAETTKPSFHA